jgi:Cft2 family RNA processing exonuclease
MRVHFEHGLHLPDLDLWLDPRERKEVAFVSHAHSDHIGSHQHVLCSPGTAALMRQRVRGRCRYRTLEFGRAYEFPGFRLTLYPAGHILGSAQALVETEAGRLLYSGDFKLRPGRSMEPIQVPQADVVVMETTFGRPQYRFPAAEEVVDAIRSFCKNTLAEGAVPVLFGYTLGKSQELLAQIAECEAPVLLHPDLLAMVTTYEALGVRFPPYRVWTAQEDPAGHIIVCPSGARRSRLLDSVARKRTAYISGWAIDHRMRWRCGADVCFPLSDHADYPELLEYVRLTGAATIHTVHGFAAEFAQDLRLMGYGAAPVEQPPQLALF